jgi:hypothetical protein
MKIFLGILTVLALVAFRQYLGDMFTTAVTGAVSADAAECISFLGSTTNEQEGRTYIIGSIRNKCEYRIDSVTIHFKVQRGYEDSPTYSPVNGRNQTPYRSIQPALEYAYVRDLKPGETQKFKSALPVWNKALVRFDKITAIR